MWTGFYKCYKQSFKILYLVDVTAATEADIRRLYCDYKAKRMVSNTTQIRCGILIMIDYYYSHGQRFCSAFGLGRVFQVSFRLFLHVYMTLSSNIIYHRDFLTLWPKLLVWQRCTSHYISVFLNPVWCSTDVKLQKKKKRTNFFAIL